jgi:hypothetical protein
VRERDSEERIKSSDGRQKERVVEGVGFQYASVSFPIFSVPQSLLICMRRNS